MNGCDGDYPHDGPAISPTHQVQLLPLSMTTSIGGEVNGGVTAIRVKKATPPPLQQDPQYILLVKCGTSRSISPSRAACSTRSSGQVQGCRTAITFKLKRGTDDGPGRRVRLRQDRPPAGPSSASSSAKSGGQVLFNGTGGLCTSLQKDSSGPCARRCRSSSRTRYLLASPRVCRSARSSARRSGSTSLSPKEDFDDYIDHGHERLRLAALPQGPLPPRVLRRPAAAYLHRPCPGPEPRIRRLRRAGFRAGRFHPGADHQPAEGLAARSTT